MERRVLIVESLSELALSMASVLKTAGYHTATAGSSAEAQRELEMRRPDLVVLRAELAGEQSGFALCGLIKKGKYGPNLPVLLLSSDVAQEGLLQHSQSPNAADRYMTMPFEMGDLAASVSLMVPIVTDPAAAPTESDDVDASLDSALTGNGVKADAPPPMPPPIRTSSGPPRLPRRERRSAITEEDRQFLERAFQSIADRKAELLAESREVRRSGPRRELMGTPEGKIQLLREELKAREAQIARISEIWSVRERELLTVEDRVHDKDVEIQGLKMQVDDLVRRLNEAQATLIQKEREHGQIVDDLLLQKFVGEKEVIEVVSAKEKEINLLRREMAGKDDELARRALEVENQRGEYEKLEKELSVATLEFEVRDKQAAETVSARDAEIASLKSDLENLTDRLTTTVTERDARYEQFEAAHRQVSDELEQARAERDATVRSLELQLGKAQEHGQAADEEIQRLRTVAAETQEKHAGQVAELEQEIASWQGKAEDLRIQRDGIAQSMTDRLGERDGKIAQLEKELGDAIERSERTEADLNAQLQGKLEHIGELEGELEATRATAADREQELSNNLKNLNAAKAEVEQRLQDTVGELARARDTIAERDLAIEGLQTDVGDREQRLADLTAQLEETERVLDGTRGQLSERDGQLQQAVATIERTQQDLQRTLQERTEREGEIKATRNELARITQVLRQTEATKAQLEEQLSAEIGQLRALLAESQGNFEAERSAHETLKVESRDTQDQLTNERDALQRQLESTTSDLEATRTALEETTAALDSERTASGQFQQQATAQIHALQERLRSSTEQAADLGEQLAATKNELGQRVADVTHLTSQLAHAQDTHGHLEERLQTVTEEAQRRDELLQNDLATKSKELADTLRKLNTLTQERARQVDALTRDVAGKSEQLKQAESRLKSLGDEAKRKFDEFDQRLSESGQESQQLRAALDERQTQLAALGKEHEAAAGERNQLRAQLAQHTQQLNAKLAELQNLVAQERAHAKRTTDDLQARLAKSEAKAAQLAQDGQARAAELDAKQREAQAHLAARAKKIQELEQAIEAAHSAKVRSDKELAARVAAAEARANEAAAKLASTSRERKDLDARHGKDLEEANTKHKQELDRREALKGQELQRLQAALQEKSKALKVVELELARYKAKATGGTGLHRVAAPPTASPPQQATPAFTGPALDEEQVATRLNSIPEAARGAGGGTAPEITQPAGFRAPATGPTSAARPAARPAVRTSPVISPPPSKRPMPEETTDRTIVMESPAKQGEADDDWTSIIDELDK